MGLPAPQVWVRPEELLRAWRATSVSADFRPPPDFDAGPSLAGRVRSALGPALRQVSARHAARHARRRRLYGLPSAFEALYSREMIAPPRAGVLFHNPARPFVLFAERLESGAVRVTVRLFGNAAIWANELAEALPLALERGVKVDATARARTRLTPRAVHLTADAPISPMPDADEVRLVFRSPVRFDRAGSLSLDLSALLSSLTARAAALAAWHGLIVDADAEALAAAAQGLRLTDDAMTPVPWGRTTSARRGRRRHVPMMGLVGSVTLRGETGPFSSFLALAESAHLGSYTSFGCGRVEVVRIR
jgi:hypothetical protein